MYTYKRASDAVLKQKACLGWESVIRDSERKKKKEKLRRKLLKQEDVNEV